MIQIITQEPALSEAIASCARHDLDSAMLTLLNSGYDPTGAVDEVCNIQSLLRAVKEHKTNQHPGVLTVYYISYVMEEK